MEPPSPQAWIRRLEDWAQREPNVRVALLVGSQARAEMPADSLSDIDLAVFAEDPDALLDQVAWVSELGPVWTSHRESTAVGAGEERRVLFEDGQDVDVAIFPVSELPVMLADPRAVAVLQRGFGVLANKDAQDVRIQTGAALLVPPKPEEVSNLVNDYWFHLVWTAKKLRRGEILTAVEATNGYLRSLLVQAVRWHAQVCGPLMRDVWHASRFFEKWADPRVLHDFPGTVAAYDPGSIAAALRAHRALFSWVSAELYAGLSMPDPLRDPRGVARYFDRLLELGANTSEG